MGVSDGWEPTCLEFDGEMVISTTGSFSCLAFLSFVPYFLCGEKKVVYGLCEDMKKNPKEGTTFFPWRVYADRLRDGNEYESKANVDLIILALLLLWCAH